MNVTQWYEWLIAAHATKHPEFERFMLRIGSVAFIAGLVIIIIVSTIFQIFFTFPEHFLLL